MNFVFGQPRKLRISCGRNGQDLWRRFSQGPEGDRSGLLRSEKLSGIEFQTSKSTATHRTRVFLSPADLWKTSGESSLETKKQLKGQRQSSKKKKSEENIYFGRIREGFLWTIRSQQWNLRRAHRREAFLNHVEKRARLGKAKGDHYRDQDLNGQEKK